jgi:hypothetical protein
MKRLVLTLSLLITLTSCADRTRYNCDTTTDNGLLEKKCR